MRGENDRTGKGIQAFTTDFLKKRNVMNVLNVLHNSRPISRASIARSTGLTPTTVSSVVSRLLDLGIVQIVGPSTIRKGRRPILIDFNPEAFYVIGLDLGIHEIRVIVVNLHGSVTARIHESIEAHRGKDYLISKMLQILQKIITDLQIHVTEKLLGIGLSIPGLIDTEKGIPLFSANLPELQNVEILRIFQKEFKIPVFVTNDVSAMALGESKFGIARGYKNILCINVGHGIGSGIIIDGELYRDMYSEGVFGHISILPFGHVCHCGSRGCLETMASGNAIASSAIRAVKSGGSATIKHLVDGKIDKISAETVANAADMGDETAQRIVKEAATYLGIAIANAIKLVSPHIIVIGGGVSKTGDMYFQTLKKTIEEYSFSIRDSFPEITISSLGDDASCIGAATLVLMKVFNKEGVPNY